MSTSPLPPESSRNAFQRWYFGRAEKFYARMSPSTREQAQAIEAFLYSARGLGVLTGLACAFLGSAFGLHGGGASWLAAGVISGVLVAGLFASVLAGWLLPERYSGRKLWTIAALMMFGTYAGRIGVIVGKGRFAATPIEGWPRLLLENLWDATPFQLIVGLMMVVLVLASSTARRGHLRRELARTRLEQERDAAAAQLAQARLSLLQAQIQPHFLFNTLAALQHWVDVGDARAAPLLRALTAFLRGSTEMMLRDGVTLGQECEMVRHYLVIMQSRLGDRLRWRVEVPPDCEAQALPPGLLITLVENAVEHGIEPRLHGGEVRVSARHDAAGAFELRVRDDGAGIAPGAPEGVGLTNSRERLRHRFGARAELRLGTPAEGGGTEALLRVQPLPGGSASG
jgi:hypothetical protein